MSHWVSRLRPSSASPELPIAGGVRHQQVAAELGPQVVSWAAQASPALVAPYRDADPAVTDETRSADLQGASLTVLGTLLRLLRQNNPTDLEPHDWAIEEARQLARRGVPEDAVVASTWLLHTKLERALLDLVVVPEGNAAEGPSDPTWQDDLMVLTSLAQATAQARLAAHRDEARRWGEVRSARRRAAFTSLAERRAVPVDAAEVLGMPLDAHHLVGVATSVEVGEPSPRHDDPGIAAFLADVASTLGRTRTVAVPSGLHTVLWWSGPRAIDSGALERLDQLEPPPGTQVSLGCGHTGADGVADSYEEACRAARATAPQGAPRLRQHDDVLLLSTLLADPRAATALVARELTGVGGTDPRMADLRHTVLMFLRHDGSRKAVAAELGLAPTTVAYRVDRFESLRGRPLTVRRLETWAALELASAVPSIWNGRRS